MIDTPNGVNPPPPSCPLCSSATKAFEPCRAEMVPDRTEPDLRDHAAAQHPGTGNAGPSGAGFDPSRQITPGGRLFHHRECSGCGLVFTTPLPTEEEQTRVYQSFYNYEWFLARRWLKRLQAEHRWRRVLSVLPRSEGKQLSLLDVGAGQGDFVHAARRAGWSALGLDPALPEAVPGFREGFESGLHLVGGPYDVITLWHTLEHLREPVKVLSGIREILRPGGTLILAVPNRNAVGLSRAGRNWGWFQEPFVHLWHWSPDALRKTLPEGFSVVGLSTRDTWDQQTFFATGIYRQAIRCGRILGRLPGLRREGSGLPVKGPDDRRKRPGSAARLLRVWILEAIHLAGYFVYLVMRNTIGVRRDRHLESAELMLVAVRSPEEPFADQGV